MTTDNPPYHNLYQQEGKKPLSAVLIMACIYIFLVIERPWESIRYLEGLQIERVYAISLIIIAFLQHKFKIVSSPTNKWVYGLLALHFLLAPFAYNPEFAVDQGIEYAKMVVLYLLMLSVADDEESLKILVKAYGLSTMLYALHSLWEYNNGRHVWRMGISRMVGVDSTFNDPNSFGATIVLSLPFVYALLRSELNKHLRRAYYFYFALAVTCVVLTGSRTSFAALMVLCMIWVLIQKGKRKLLILVTALMTMAVVWNVMPEEKQERFRTLWDDEAGPANARESAEGRMVGWKVSWRMFKQQPMTGVGAGGKNYIGYRMSNLVDDGEPSPNQSHILYGEVLAELGLFGAGLFLGLIFSIWRCCRWARSYLRKNADDDPFLANLAGAILAALLLLLVFGIGGHNFYRPLWLWLAAWSGTLYMFAIRKTENRA
jgi:hypothetical protein